MHLEQSKRVYFAEFSICVKVNVMSKYLPLTVQYAFPHSSIKITSHHPWKVGEREGSQTHRAAGVEGVYSSC